MATDGAGMFWCPGLWGGVPRPLPCAPALSHWALQTHNATLHVITCATLSSFVHGSPAGHHMPQCLRCGRGPQASCVPWHRHPRPPRSSHSALTSSPWYCLRPRQVASRSRARPKAWALDPLDPLTAPCKSLPRALEGGLSSQSLFQGFDFWAYHSKQECSGTLLSQRRAMGVGRARDGSAM